jgi:hypothetical protein
VRNQQPDLKKHGAAIEQLRDALARSELSVMMLLFYLLWSAALPKLIFQFEEAVHQLFHVAGGGGLHDFRIQNSRTRSEDRKKKRARNASGTSVL